MTQPGEAVARAALLLASPHDASLAPNAAFFGFLALKLQCALWQSADLIRITFANVTAVSLAPWPPWSTAVAHMLIFAGIFWFTTASNDQLP